MYQYPPLRSINANADRPRSYVRFHNLTKRNVDIIWINFTGEYVCYMSLSSGEAININTFKNHPWIAFDHDTKDRMHLEKKFVYQPQTSKEYFEEHYPNHRFRDGTETRIVVKITLPVYSLRYCTLLFLKNYFNQPEDVDRLDLPGPLLDDLKKLLEIEII
ncbi:hypothetical protein HHI36_002872 [Cryptolaemus montrouzieri]|uniref:von Hippel-Lindau disease tumour suppressor beta domain-containing protein n=1 Tax=Cryptolaemus montrouzieri TaxID=559131 RepID=A0ABD2PCP5_9CUCU